MTTYSIVVLAIVGIVGFMGRTRSRKIMGVVGIAGALVVFLVHQFMPSGPTLTEQQETYLNFMSEIEHWVAIVDSTSANYHAMDELAAGSIHILEALARGAGNNMGNITLSGRMEAENTDRLHAIQENFQAYAHGYAEAYKTIVQLVEMNQLEGVEAAEAELDDANRYRNEARAKAEELEALLELR